MFHLKIWIFILSSLVFVKKTISHSENPYANILLFTRVNVMSDVYSAPCAWCATYSRGAMKLIVTRSRVFIGLDYRLYFVTRYLPFRLSWVSACPRQQNPNELVTERRNSSSWIMIASVIAWMRHGQENQSVPLCSLRIVDTGPILCFIHKLQEIRHEMISADFRRGNAVYCSEVVLWANATFQTKHPIQYMRNVSSVKTCLTKNNLIGRVQLYIHLEEGRRRAISTTSARHPFVSYSNTQLQQWRRPRVTRTRRNTSCLWFGQKRHISVKSTPSDMWYFYLGRVFPSIKWPTSQNETVRLNVKIAGRYLISESFWKNRLFEIPENVLFFDVDQSRTVLQAALCRTPCMRLFFAHSAIHAVVNVLYHDDGRTIRRICCNLRAAAAWTNWTMYNTIGKNTIGKNARAKRGSKPRAENALKTHAYNAEFAGTRSQIIKKTKKRKITMIHRNTSGQPFVRKPSKTIRYRSTAFKTSPGGCLPTCRTWRQMILRTPPLLARDRRPVQWSGTYQVYTRDEGLQPLAH